MRGYGLDYWQVMNLPLVAFWGLNKSLDRLRAEEDIRALQNGLVAVSRSEESIKTYRKQLQSEMGTVYVQAPKLDRAGLHALKAFSK